MGAFRASRGHPAGDEARGGRDPAAPGPVLLANPIPLALQRYVHDLRLTLEDGGRAVQVLESRGTERLAEGSVMARVRNARRFYAECSRTIDRGDVSEVVACWPLFGHLDILFWSVRARRQGGGGSRVSVVWHDLRQPGRFRELRSWGTLLTGALPERAARVGGRVTLVVHTEAVATELRARGWDRVVCLPHPIGPMTAHGQAAAAPVRAALTVAGRYKPIRDLDLLEGLGRRRAAEEDPYLVMGHGWPAVSGWDVVDGFVPEDEFQSVLRESRAVLIPYAEYSQSGVAMRAFEEGTPVIGIRHPQLEEMYGPDYPGVVDVLSADEVRAALGRVGAEPRDRWLEAADAYRRRSSRLWAEYMSAR